MPNPVSNSYPTNYSSTHMLGDKTTMSKCNSARRHLYFMLLAAILALAACIPPTPELDTEATPIATPAPSAGPDDAPIPLKVQITAFMGTSRLHFAQAEGYFAEQGLEVEFITLVSGSEALPALIQGDLDVGAGAVSAAALNAIARGAPLRMVAETGAFARDHCSSHALLGRSELAAAGVLAHAARVRDMRLATNPAGMEGFYVDRYLQSLGLSIDELQVTDVPAPALAEALQAGQLDLAHTSEPWLTRITQSGAASIIAPASEILPDYTLSVLLFGPNLLEKNPEVGRRFMVAYQQAVRQYNQGKTDRNVALLAEHTGLDPALITELCWPAASDHGRIFIDGILDFQAWAFDRGLLDQIVPVEQFWDPRFVAYANEMLGAETR
jgi:NitT/TauT family transport system substrate-binding protein